MWEKYPGNPVVTLKNHGALQVDEWRDPFLFREAGRTYMVCGGNLNSKRGGGGAVQLYEAVNPGLTEWRHRGVVFEYRDRAVWNIECPNLFKLGSKWVLLMSPQKALRVFRRQPRPGPRKVHARYSRRPGPRHVVRQQHFL